MKQLDFDDLTQPIESVFRAEQSINTGEKMYQECELFFRRNPALLAAHKRAAVEFQRLGVRPSPRLMTEIARWISNVGFEGFVNIIGAYMGVEIEHGKPFKIPNVSVTYLGRLLESWGFDVTTHKSIIDEAWEREHGGR